MFTFGMFIQIRSIGGMQADGHTLILKSRNIRDEVSLPICTLLSVSYARYELTQCHMNSTISASTGCTTETRQGRDEQSSLPTMKNGSVASETNSLESFTRNMTNTNVITDETVHETVEQILASDMSPQKKAFNLDTLSFMVWKYHPEHMAAKKALDEISSAIDKVLGL